MSIANEDWNFEAIRQADPARADILDHARSPELLLRTIVQSLEEGIDRNNWRLAVDSRDDGFVEGRGIVQFQITPQTYDWFFNARTGYRSRFWIDPEVGLNFKGLPRSLISSPLPWMPPTS